MTTHDRTEEEEEEEEEEHQIKSARRPANPA
jgi:hypothetical protein